MNGRAVWARDLAMGARFAFGGREGWIRTLLTGVGVGLGVALLLISTAIPGAFAARIDREAARESANRSITNGPRGDTLLAVKVNQNYHGLDIGGRLVEAESPRAPLPPGLTKIPGPGELAVSPALGKLLDSADGALLRERLDGRVTETVGDAGLTGPGELLFYLGGEKLEQRAPQEFRVLDRIGVFGATVRERNLDPVLTLLVVLTFVALLTPIAVFIAAAVRLGGEGRDQRLAALRLVGADSPMVRRIAAGEALVGSLAGLLFGAGFFLIGRGLVGSVTLGQRSIFPADLDPSPGLVLLVALAVPAAAVAVTLFTLRGVVVEPLGTVHRQTPGRRRIWWRLLLPAAGLGLLATMPRGAGETAGLSQWQVAGGALLLLVGITALLPWVLERAVGRLSGGPVSFQLAVRRLQVSTGTAARLVNGIAVAVAGAIALQMLFSGVEDSYTRETGQDPTRAAVAVVLRDGDGTRLDTIAGQISAAPGVARTVPLATFRAAHQIPVPDIGQRIDVTVGTCEALAEVAVLDSCKEGDAFVLTAERGIYGATAKPGDELFTGDVSGYGTDGEPAAKWTFPAGARKALGRPDPTGLLREGLLVTPSAAPKDLGDGRTARIFVQLDDSVPDALELVRTATFKAAPFATAMTLKETYRVSSYGAIRTGLLFGATGVLVLIGTSLLVYQLEQLRERRKLLSALVAFGTKRSTLGLSVLWQTALPVGVGVALAAVAGIGLGSLLRAMTSRPLVVDWTVVATMTGAGAGLVVAVTLLSLPPLLRLVRPDGLRTE
ncbi:ABC transporter permease [Streptomyces sp. NBC_00249]|uniref:ABC transporter permease n=1 Tax=Streptomyces sp. NBC_00249 TaxID=2975690 RepID=UPI002252F306|nr:FtsX-like permease family protein [Streptomyces sp. NBC_00249]MCX5194669.1 ABC transporter permease [Streptomyces sp. NBC_00249]